MLLGPRFDGFMFCLTHVLLDHVSLDPALFTGLFFWGGWIRVLLDCGLLFTG